MSDEYRPKREHPRVSVRLDVRVTQIGTESAGELIFETRDLSEGGAFLRSDLLLDAGDECDLAFELPDAPAVTLRARARVAWTSRQPLRHGPGMGVEFVQIPEEDEQRLADFLSRS